MNYLRRMGFGGPYPRSRHEYMQKGPIKVSIPNPHRSDIGRTLLAQILRQAEISREEWESL